MDLTIINERVDHALRANRRAENLVTGMAAAIFTLGMSLVVVAYWRINHYFGTGTLVAQVLLYWPIREIIRLRRDNLIVQTVPAIVTALPPAQVAVELRKLIVYLQGLR